MVNLFLLYGVECWSVKSSHVQKIYVVEMRMSGNTRSDKIRNIEVNQEKVRVAAFVADKMRETRLMRWFGYHVHLQKSCTDAK
ncbi:hypothetical protein H5410_006688 [Solanum commersonii]|uniref:Uncharacterized protein n=1 Tax=Solanum commersonii TaxID=4109 RepID=A0A9J6A9T8_SOLCO|nr:hypothetical protein H5410_006688 [Solanum commersonii]